MKKNEMICVFRDEAHEVKTRDALKQSQSNISKAIEIYKELTGEEITAKNFEDLLQSGASMVTQDFEQKATIPAGHDKAAYLRLLKYPDVSELTNLLNVTFKEYLAYDGDAVSLKPEAETLVTKNNVYLTPDQNEVYKTLKLFIDTSNRLLKHNIKATTGIINSGYNEILSQKSYPHGEYQLSLENAIHFIKSK